MFELRKFCKIMSAMCFGNVGIEVDVLDCSPLHAAREM